MVIVQIFLQISFTAVMAYVFPEYNSYHMYNGMHYMM